MLVVLAAFSFLLKHGVRWFIPVLIFQSLVLAAAGERTPVITDAITLILMLLLAGSRPSTRQLRGASALTLIAILAITGLRVEQGRSLFYKDSGLSARIFALASGLNEFTNNSDASSTGPPLIAQSVVRVDGVDFAGAILQSLSFGQPRLSAAYVPESLLLVVPSSVWSSKLAHGNALNPAHLEINDFGLQQVNFLPTLPGLYIGFLSAPWLIAFLAFIGLLCGWGERWLFRRCTPVRLVFLAGAVIAALSYEAGLPAMLVACARRRMPLVPRAIWPGKPILDTGYEFSQTYYELPATVYTSSAITPVGDLYLHGGWIPVIVGMFLLGCGVRLLDDVMDVYGNPHCIFLFLLLFPSLVKQEDDWVGILAGIPGTLLIWLFATYLTFRKRERPPRSPSWRGPG